MTKLTRNSIVFLLAIALLALQIDADKKSARKLRAKFCRPEKCQLPDCLCSGLTLPVPEFQNRTKEIPQLVMVSFDDAVTPNNYEEYQQLFAGLANPDHCPAVGTFYVSHDYTDYSKVHALYADGHEIALHSITHKNDMDYWRNAGEERIKEEFGGQIEMLETYAKVRREDIRGIRMPFLQMSGNATFAAMQRLNLTYDSSWPTQQFARPPMWPYTLDYHSVQDCMIKPCPTTPVPGFWTLPMVTWTDTKGYSCAMLDGCINMPKDSIDEIYQWLLKHFKAHYEDNRAPFGVFLHAAWFQRGPHNFPAFKKFLNYMNTLPDVYFVPSSRVIEFMRNPVLGIPFKGCPPKPTTKCSPKQCVIPKEETNELRYMNTCDRCPNVYPWLDNLMGE